MRVLRTARWLAALARRGPCAFCRVPGGRPLCESCRRASLIGTRPWSARLAGKPLHFVAAYRGRTEPDSRSLTPLAAALYAFKENGDRYAGRCVAGVFAECCAPLLREGDVVVPVPPDPGRLRQRGYSPAAWLARALARGGGLRLCTSALRRVPGRPAQRRLRGLARRINARGAFSLGRRSLPGYSVVLVDDVATTGATLREASRLLREAGASAVRPVVLACADDEVVSRCHATTDCAGSGGTSGLRT